jgi:tetratricopeptide (TPR) repeat protein
VQLDIENLCHSSFYKNLIMMPSRFTDNLFQLVKSLEKAEKRNFKLYIKRSSAKEDLKIIELFDALDKLAEYDELLLLKKLPSIQKPQLANIKVHLYKQLLASLRLIKSTDSIDMQLNEQLDYARILYNKGLYMQSLKILEKLTELAKEHYKYNFLTQVVAWEKKIESLHITRSMTSRAEFLAQETFEVNTRVSMVSRMSSLALHLYSMYISNGHARNEKDEAAVIKFFTFNLPSNSHKQTGFYERLYLYQSYCWYAFIRQDFLQYYRYAQKWVDIFHEQPLMIKVETGYYIKGIHNLLNAHFDLRNFEGFDIALKQFKDFAATDLARKHDNHRVQTFVYISSAAINRHFMDGSFEQGLAMIPELESKLEEYGLFLDNHRLLVFNYKIANLYFGSGKYDIAIDYLQRIININPDLRSDLQCYARLLHLMAHYELGNFEIMESLIRSVYRFMAKMQNLTVVEEEMFKFLRNAFLLSRTQLKLAFENFLVTLKKLENDRFQTRSFAYLDIISWVESKVIEKPLSKVINEKYLARRKRHYEV